MARKARGADARFPMPRAVRGETSRGAGALPRPEFQPRGWNSVVIGNPDARKGKQGHTTKKPVLVAVERAQDDRPGRVQAVPLPSKEREVVHQVVRASRRRRAMHSAGLRSVLSSAHGEGRRPPGIHSAAGFPAG
jgi:hypothetical protein